MTDINLTLCLMLFYSFALLYTSISIARTFSLEMQLFHYFFLQFSPSTHTQKTYFIIF